MRPREHIPVCWPHVVDITLMETVCRVAPEHRATAVAPRCQPRVHLNEAEGHAPQAVDSAEAALALVMLATGPINLELPHEHHPAQAAA